ncbi:hypothetical protein KY284_030071 [Solanum tuberosum]|nr:hypothetical protein KY284_030071 [Solanum tuberosum]
MLLEPQCDGLSCSGLARDFQDEPSQGPMTSVKAKARKGKAVIMSRSWLNKLKSKCWTRATVEKITPQWQAGRGRTNTHGWHKFETFHGELGLNSANIEEQLVENTDFHEAATLQINGLMKNNEDHQNELALLHLVLTSSNPVCGEDSKVKVLEPMSFDGVSGAKEFENFMWGLEHCFATAHLPKADKLTITVRYFRRMQFCGGGQRIQ